MTALALDRPLLVVIEGDGAEDPEDGPDVEALWLAGAPRGAQVLRAIGDYQSQHPWCPSKREVLAAATGIRSMAHLQYWLHQLADRGFLAAWGHGLARQLALTDCAWWAYAELDGPGKVA